MRKLLIETDSSSNSNVRIGDAKYHPLGQAGTDHPWYMDFDLDISADFEDDDARPFAYFPVNPTNIKELKFFISEDYDGPIVHNELFSGALEEYICNFIRYKFDNGQERFCELMGKFYDNTVERNGFKYVYDHGSYTYQKDGNVIDLKDVIAEAFHHSGIDLAVNNSLTSVIYNVLEDSGWDNGQIVDDLIDYMFDHYDFRDDWDQDCVCSMLSIDINGLFNSSRLMGRIWTDKDLITFYPGQQPSRDEMRQVISDISNNTSMSEDELYAFHTIFEVGSKEAYTGSGYKTHNDAQIQCCTVADYIEGKYSGFNRDEEMEMVKNRKGVDRFCPHLANQEQKREFFKDFRKTRDNAVYAPREKAAGSLAAYHAMRYPFGENRIIKEDYQRNNEAGTDAPYFHDPDTGFEIEGHYDDRDACSFGYFRYDIDSPDLKLFCCYDCGYDSECIHRDLIKKIIMDNVDNVIEEIEEHEDEIITYLKEYQYNTPNKYEFSKILTEIFEDAGVEYKPTENFAERLYAYLSQNNWSNKVLSDGLIRDFADELWEYWVESDEAEIYYGDAFNVSYSDILYSGRLLGRIWTDKGLITFYPGQQPSRDEMNKVITDLSSKIGVEYDDLLNFYTIFETGSKTEYTGTGYKGHNDATIQCCTVADYIEGKYNGFNKEEESEMVKNRKGVDQLNIHLANQEDKRKFFKDFIKNRDNAVYAPREKGAGTLAAYHAMRYPYGESKKANGKLIKEDDGISRISDSWMSHVDDSGPSSLSSIDFPSTSSSFGSSGSYDCDTSGTDFPSFYDDKRERMFEGNWQDNGTHPFAFFESSPSSLMFHVGDEKTTHSGVAYYIAKNYYLKERWDEIRNEVRKVAEGMLDDINKYIANYFYSNKGSQPDLDSAVDRIYDEIENIYNSYTNATDYGVFVGLFGKKLSFLVDNKMHFEKESLYELLYNILIESCGKEGDDEFDNRLYFLRPLFAILDEDYDDYFYRGRLEGRIFTESELISFYDKQQPTSAELDDIVRRLSKDPKVGVSYDDMLAYEIIYNDNGKVSGCPVYEYIMKKPLDKEINPDEREGSVFIPHLAKPEEKRGFFKGFRDARDKAVYAPREKAAGTLAAYHAMRYPYGENKHDRRPLINEGYFGTSSCAGTDFPYYYDEDTGEVYEARWDDGYGFPFGYWPVDKYGYEEFIAADYGETHADACGKAAEKYFYSVVDDLMYSCADEICSAIDDISKEFEKYGYTYDEEEDRYVSSDGTDTFTRDELFDRVYDSISEPIGDMYSLVSELIDEFLESNTIFSYQEIEEKIRESVEDECSFWGRDEIDKSLSIIGSSFDDFFEEGHSEGRIWPEHEMIGFYDTQQPSPDELEKILHDLADYMGYDYEEFMDYHMIYEDWDDGDAEIKITTLGDYINGPHEEDKQYAKDGKTVFIPHLASPEEKRDFFKDFRDTRDRVKFVPREKGAGNLAAYHAMRYPFGENKKRIWKQVSEEVERILSNQKRVYIKESALKRIAKSIKGKKMSNH